MYIQKIYVLLFIYLFIGARVRNKKNNTDLNLFL